MELKKQLIIEIPFLPPKQASPNWQPLTAGAGYVGLKAKNIFKRSVFLCAVNARNLWELKHGMKWETLEKATIKPTFIIKSKSRIMDDDNTIAMLKGIDCLKASEKNRGNRAEIIKDDAPECLTIKKPKWVVDKSRAPMTILEMEEDSEPNSSG